MPKSRSRSGKANLNVYNNINRTKQAVNVKEGFDISFVRGAFVQAKGSAKKRYMVEFTDGKNNIYRTNMTNGQWTKCTRQFYIPYVVKITDLDQQKTIVKQEMNLEGKKVFIEFGSSALGDSIAWMPYVEVFQKKHKCEILCMTYHNYLFKSAYPSIEFIEPGTPYTGIYAAYDLGWFYTEDGKPSGNHHKLDFRSMPMQMAATDILGLDYQELKPRLGVKPTGKHPLGSRKYVCIANHATLQAKYWNNRVGWQKLVDYLKDKGYSVVVLSKEQDGHNGNDNPKGVLYPPDYEMDTIMTYIKYCSFFVGVGTGLTWLSWAMNKPTAMISGFSETYTEMQTDIIRIGAKEGMCTGCFNRVRLADKGEWHWCPDHEETDRQFECTKTLTAADVIERLQPLLVDKKAPAEKAPVKKKKPALAK